MICLQKMVEKSKKRITFVAEMRRMLKNGWMIVLLTVRAGWQRDEAGVAQEPELTATLMLPQDGHHHEATLTDATQLYRVCSSRPQRLLPTNSTKTERTTSPAGMVRRNIVKPLHPFHDRRCRLERAPHPLTASCDYYVIALRHIIR